MKVQVGPGVQGHLPDVLGCRGKAPLVGVPRGNRNPLGEGFQGDHAVPWVEGHLFDIYHLEDVIHFWIIDKDGAVHLIQDTFYPVIYAYGDSDLLRRLTHRMIELDVLGEPPVFVEKTHFYRNKKIRVLQYSIKRPSFLRTVHRKLYAFVDKLEIYHSDIEVTTHYMLEKEIFPLAHVRAYVERKTAENHRGGYILKQIETLEGHESFDYSLPRMRTMRMSLAGNYRLGIPRAGPLILEWDAETRRIPLEKPERALVAVNEILLEADPDVILSSHGDQTIFPSLFHAAQECGLPLSFDRDPVYTRRKIVTKGSSYHSYGSIIFRAPSYPLFGRWHIDSLNSFVFRESRLAGIIELARLSRLPVQRLARSSTGTAMTAIQTETALKRGYLVPWQKSRMEKEKTALELLTVDKGGLVYEPDIRAGPVHENVVQIDYSQMYPSIMVNHNISPETVKCDCCTQGEPVPESASWVCQKRAGIVAASLAPILARRRYLKQRLKETSGLEREIIDEKQSSLKWLLVTSFGYLGYRNAKFGKLESHEAVTAFGRHILLRAKEISEAAGFSLLHAITDCLFIKKRDGSCISDDDPILPRVFEEIHKDTGIEIVSEGVYSWIVFVPSRQDILMPVATRYFGRLSDGTIKIRGIAARRKDTAPFLKAAQQNFLAVMAGAERMAALRNMHGEMDKSFQSALDALYAGSVDWRDLLMRRTATRTHGEYSVSGPAAVSLQDLANLGIETTAGEKVRYLLGHPKEHDAQKRYISEEAVLAGAKKSDWSAVAYHRLLLEVYREVWEYFAPAGYFAERKAECKESLNGKRGQGRLAM